MSNFNIGDRVQDLGSPSRFGVVRNNTRQQFYGSKATWIDVEWDGEPYRPTGYGLQKSNLKLVKDEPVTPEVGDTIRATRGETVVVGRVTFHSPEFGTDIVLDDKTSASVRGEYEIEIIKPKIVPPTGRFALIKFRSYMPYVRTESGKWMNAGGLIDVRYTDEELLDFNKRDQKFEILYAGA